MRILALSPRFPYPPHKGDQLTVLNLLKFFSQNHEIDLYTFVENPEELDYLSEVEPYCRRIDTVILDSKKAKRRCWRALPTSTPLQVAYYDVKEMWDKVRQAMAQETYDLAYVHYIRMAPYMLYEDRLPRILGMQLSFGMNSRRLARHARTLKDKLLHRVEAFKMSRKEWWYASRYDIALLISDHDRRYVTRYGLTDNIRINPHGVDTGFFSPDPSVEIDPKRIVMTGNMQYPPNVDAVLFFAEEILPIIRQEEPQAHFYAVGRDPTPLLTRLNERPNVTITGAVDDIRPYIRSAMVAVDSLRIGAGLQNKVLEALSSGTPVVMTAMANEGIRATEDEMCSIADTPEEFAQAVLQIMRDPALHRRLSQAARNFILAEWTWEKHFKDLEGWMEELVVSRNQ